MVRCPRCGEENPPKFRLCGYCGSPLAAAALPTHELRKTVTNLRSAQGVVQEALDTLFGAY